MDAKTTTTTTLTTTTTNNFIRMEAVGEVITLLETTTISRPTPIHRDILRRMVSRTRLLACQLLCLGSLIIICNNMLPQASYHQNLMETPRVEYIAPYNDRIISGTLCTLTQVISYLQTFKFFVLLITH